jgi:peptidoglycan/xylan/chitin deacetylase (PgdA/CDA1 family)
MSDRVWFLRTLQERVMRRLVGTITHVSTQSPVVALTFDDGPHPEFTPRLLDVLNKYQAHATFFMVGTTAQRYPELVKRVAQAGHAIGNHSWDHPSFPLITKPERRAQIRACAEAIAPYGSRLFRPPYGHQNTASRLDALWLGYRVITWNVVAYDWLDHDADWITTRVIHEIRSGNIILLHDSLYHLIEERYADREPVIDAVNRLLEQLGRRYRFVTVPELLLHGRPQLTLWYRQASPDWLNQLKGQSGEVWRYPQDSIGK